MCRARSVESARAVDGAAVASDALALGSEAIIVRNFFVVRDRTRSENDLSKATEQGESKSDEPLRESTTAAFPRSFALCLSTDDFLGSMAHDDLRSAIRVTGMVDESRNIAALRRIDNVFVVDTKHLTESNKKKEKKGEKRRNKQAHKSM